MDHKCKNNPDSFCYICGNVVLPNRQAKITDFVKKAYRNNFGVKLEDQDKPFNSHVCCKTCVEILMDQKNRKRKSMPCVIPMVCWEGTYYILDCYFGMINLKAINRKYKHHIKDSDVPSVVRRISLGPDLPVPEL